ncbi:hypothetical protein [Vreelandella sp. TE19]
MQAFSVVLIRVLAIYLIVTPVMVLWPAAMSASGVGEFDQWRLIVITGVLPALFIGALLWFKAPAIGQRLHRYESAPSAALDEAGLVRAGSFLIGVYLLVQHLGGLLSTLGFAGRIDYGALAVILLSLVLILGVNFIEKLYHRFRNF